MDRKCEITNGDELNVLYVDNVEISFYGNIGISYFQYHFKNLGYQINIRDARRIPGQKAVI